MDGQSRVIHPLGQAEISEPDHAVIVEQQVRRLDVTVNDSALMCVRQGLGTPEVPTARRPRAYRITCSLRLTRTSARLRPAINCMA